MRQPLESNLQALRERIALAARAAHRDPGSIALVAVTKGVEADLALALVPLGVVDLGENRVDELEHKAAAAREHGLAVRWHFIGHLQRNKARRAAAVADVVHSVDSEALLRDLDKHCTRSLDVYLQVHLSGEAEKHGFDAHQLPPAARLAVALSHVRLVGLMTLAPRPDAEAADPHAGAGPVFAELARLGAALETDPEVGPALPDGRCRLSMGMSGDLEHAVAAGADVLRVGGAIFEGVSSNLGPQMHEGPIQSTRDSHSGERGHQA